MIKARKFQALRVLSKEPHALSLHNRHLRHAWPRIKLDFLKERWTWKSSNHFTIQIKCQKISTWATEICSKTLPGGMWIAVNNYTVFTNEEENYVERDKGGNTIDTFQCIIVSSRRNCRPSFSKQVRPELSSVGASQILRIYGWEIFLDHLNSERGKLAVIYTAKITRPCPYLVSRQ